MVKEQIENALGVSDSKLVHSNKEYGFDIFHIIQDKLPYQLLYTVGLSNNIQDVDQKNAGLEKIELYFALPSFWNIDLHSWPIQWLNRITQVPQKNNTWFGMGDTIPAGNPPEFLHDAFDANHFMICSPDFLAEDLSGEKWAESEFKMLAVMVLFQNEVDYKLRNSHTVLQKKLRKKAVNEVLDTYRTSVCRKRIIGII
ncbi:MAG: hypothetical protein ACI857_001814 [Arenicella sp.]|jgi:hypothetical protein